MCGVIGCGGVFTCYVQHETSNVDVDINSATNRSWIYYVLYNGCITMFLTVATYGRLTILTRQPIRELHCGYSIGAIMHVCGAVIMGR